MRRLALFGLLGVLIGAAGATSLGTAQGDGAFPVKIQLPNGFQPEGIAIGRGTTFFVGSIPTGAIRRGNLRTGETASLVAPQTGRSAIGIAVDRRNRLFVAGGATGQGYVYDARTGAPIASYQFTGTPTFVNDVVVTRDAAYFTESNATKQVLYKVAIARNGALASTAQTIPLTGDIVYQAGPPPINANGIDATPNGKTLVIVQSNTGFLFTVDPQTGVTRRIDLGGATVVNGDGILLDGKTLYVVQNRQNVVTVIRLSSDLRSGTIVGQISGDLDIPSTIDEHGRRLYAVNARFGTSGPQPAKYWITQLRKQR